MAKNLNGLRNYSDKIAVEISAYKIPSSLSYGEWQSCKTKVSELGSKIPSIIETRDEITQIYTKAVKLKEIVKKVFNANGQNGNYFVSDSEIEGNGQAAQQNYDSLLESFKNWELFNNNGEYAADLADLCGLQMMFYHALKSIISRVNKVINDCMDMICVLDTVKSYYNRISQRINTIRKTQWDRFQQSTLYEDYAMNKNGEQQQNLESLFAEWWNTHIYQSSVEETPPSDAQKIVVLYTG